MDGASCGTGGLEGENDGGGGPVGGSCGGGGLGGGDAGGGGFGGMGGSEGGGDGSGCAGGNCGDTGTSGEGGGGVAGGGSGEGGELGGEGGGDCGGGEGDFNSNEHWQTMYSSPGEPPCESHVVLWGNLHEPVAVVPARWHVRDSVAQKSAQVSTCAALPLVAVTRWATATQSAGSKQDEKTGEAHSQSARARAT